MKKKAVIIGSGFAGLSAASFMAKAGWQVDVLEKHATPGGRARRHMADGFSFDMGPSWYWMPDVFERYFQCFGRKVSDYYRLQRLDPSYRVYTGEGAMDVPARLEELKQLFASIEPGADKNLDLFLEQAAYKYRVGMSKLVFKPGQSLRDFLDADVIKGVFRLDILQSMRTHVAKYFTDPRLRQLMEFPVLFLGAMPDKIPALYSLMNHADIVGGTWYPENGMYSIVEAMHALACETGASFHFQMDVQHVAVNNGKASLVVAKNSDGHEIDFAADVVIAAADYHFVETSLLHPSYRSYSDSYWNSRVMAPGCLLYYVGLNKRLNNAAHHTLFLDADFEKHGKEIYTTKEWPADPLFYACTSSVTDPACAPEGHENLFLLIPVAAGLQNDNEELRETYFRQIIGRMEKRLGEPIEKHVVYKKSFANSDFIKEYNAFKGNAYGLANTLLQTAVFKPSCRSKKVSNLFYTGQLTVPGPGVPPSLISGEVVTREVTRAFGNT